MRTRFCLIFLFIPFLLIAAISSCSNSEPQIDYGFIQLVYYPPAQGGGLPAERYSFFVLAYDDDGIDNLNELYLYHDREGLRWKMEEDDWVMVEENDNAWIGSRNIAMPDGEFLPRGLFRAVLINKGGEKTERVFSFDGPVNPRFPYPRLTVYDGNFSVDSQYPVNRFIGYDQQGERIQIVDIEEKEGAFRDIRVSGNVYSVSIWAEDADHRTSALTQAVRIRE